MGIHFILAIALFWGTVSEATSCLVQTRSIPFIQQEIQHPLQGPREFRFARAGRSIKLHLFGPAELVHQHGEDPFWLAERDANITDQLIFAVEQARVKMPDAQIRVKVFPYLTIAWYTPRNAPLPGGLPPDSDSKNADLILIYDEVHIVDDPSIDLSGIAAQVAFEQIEIGLGNFWKEFIRVRSERLMEHVGEVESNYSDKDWATFGRLLQSPELATQIDDAIRLRIAWDSKLGFSQRHNHLVADNVKHDLMRELNARQGLELRRYMRKRFKQQYCQSLPYMLNPILVDLVWQVVPPKLVEYGLSNPFSMITLFKLHESFKFNPLDANDPFNLLVQRP